MELLLLDIIESMPKYTVIGADWCKYCREIKEYMTNHKLDFEYLDIAIPENKEKQREIRTKHDYKFIPIILADGEFIGGTGDFYALIEKIEKASFVLWFVTKNYFYHSFCFQTFSLFLQFLIIFKMKF